MTDFRKSTLRRKGLQVTRFDYGSTVEPSNLQPRRMCTDARLLGNAKKRYKESSAKASALRPEEETEQVKSEKLIKRLRCILNVVKPETLQKVVRQVKDLKIDTEERLQRLTDLILEKAIERKDSSVYASICHALMDLNVSNPDKPGIVVTFRTLLINRCMKEFGNVQHENDEVLERKRKLEVARSVSERYECTTQLGNAMFKAYRRSLGNIRFIGELYNENVLAAKVIHNCACILLKNRDEMSLECLCQLLTVTAETLHVDSDIGQVDHYFDQIRDIITEGKTSNRIKVFLEDTLALKKGTQGPHKPEAKNCRPETLPSLPEKSNATIEKELSDVKDDKYKKALLAMDELQTKHRQQLVEASEQAEKVSRELLAKQEKQFKETLANKEEQFKEDLAKQEKQFNEIIANKEGHFNEMLTNQKEQFNEIHANQEEQFKEMLTKQEEQFKETLANKEEQFKEDLAKQEEQFNEIIANNEGHFIEMLTKQKEPAQRSEDELLKQDDIQLQKKKKKTKRWWARLFQSRKKTSANQ